MSVDAGVTRAAGAVKVSVNLPRGEIGWLRNYAATRSITVTQAFRQAIALLKFIAGLPTGSKFIVEEPNGDRREVVFHGFA